MDGTEAVSRALWLRPEGENRLDHAQMALFALSFDVTSAPEKAILHVSAADRYRLYVNGVSALAGPRRGDAHSHYFETLDIAPLLRAGRNTLVARVVSFADYGVSGEEWGPFSVYTAHLGSVFLLAGSAGDTDLTTGAADWRAGGDASFGMDNRAGGYMIYTEKFFADKLLPWREGAALDLPAARAVFRRRNKTYGEFYPIEIVPRRIPNMFEKPGAFARVIAEKSDFEWENGRAVIPAGQTRVMEMDADALTTAYFRLRAGGRGGKIKIIYAERYFPADPDAHAGNMRRDDARGEIKGFFDEMYLSERSALFESYWFRVFRFVRLEITAGEQAVSLDAPDYLETGYPLESKAKIDFPNENLSKLWTLAERTLRLCMHETYEDCPYYEQQQYAQDTRLQMLFTYALSGDTRLAANALWDFHSSRLPNGLTLARCPNARPQVIPNFSLYFVFMLEDYVMQTGEKDSLRAYLPTAEGILEYFRARRNADGLVENLGYWEFGDWLPEWDAGVPEAVKHGASTLHNLTYALALRSAAWLVEWFDRREQAAEYARQAAEINRIIVDKCFDEARGMLREGPDFMQFTQHSQALAALSGALTGNRAREALRRAMTEKDALPCTFPWQFTLFRALEKTDLYELTAPVWRQYEALLDKNLTTIPESPGDCRSECHGWSALPLYDIPRVLLGVRPAAPGWEKIEIRPCAMDLPALSGTVPTPKGDVTVAWRMENGAMRLRVTAPAVPTEIILNGQTHHTNGGVFEG